MKQQQGFTLVEIAIVLVIIGLLLGGVLKGQEIITNAKVKNLENSVDGLAAAIYSYQDRYQAYPGDDNRATRFPSVTKVGDGDGIIKGDFNSAIDTDESSILWLHLRNSGLVSGEIAEGNSAAFSKPRNAFGGVTGAATSGNAPATQVRAITGTYIGFTNIPNPIAIILETRADEGDVQKGS
ncbi:MAG: prepilin-type N-terminal cleavage/methylation domain-containing protein, partial [Thiotrichaceae bacterium]